MMILSIKLINCGSVWFRKDICGTKGPIPMLQNTMCVCVLGGGGLDWGFGYILFFYKKSNI